MKKITLVRYIDLIRKENSLKLRTMDLNRANKEMIWLNFFKECVENGVRVNAIQGLFYDNRVDKDKVRVSLNKLKKVKYNHSLFDNTDPIKR